MSTEPQSLLLLLNWMSPAFPIGSFAFSHGLETAIADGRVRTPEALQDWIENLLQSGSGWNDAVFFARCWDGDPDELNELALALAGSAERHFETLQLGRNFANAAAIWTQEDAAAKEQAYPIAAGSACMRMGIANQQALLAFLQGIAAALVSVAVRLVPLGQTSGLKVLRNLAPVMAQVASRAGEATLDGLGSHCIASDIAAMRHEVLEPRIFRT